MGDSFGAYDTMLEVLKTVLFVVVVLIGIVCFVDWLVRTRRINPFNPVARFMRSTIDPLMAPVERRIVRAGGMPTAAPWWTLVFAAVASILLIWMLGLLRGLAGQLGNAASMGPGGLAFLLVMWTFGVLRIALIVRVISSWFRISPYSRWIRWSYELTEWILRPLRQIIPTVGMIDITPLVAFVLLHLLQGLFLATIGGR
jgi:YggT family protein